ncbi:protein translocase subunit SecD [Desulfovibrio subterraneus]|uniref:protein translocase subunit SecD n=1 Tax=Desulfovibrio subterraneus TaxID=2718620 RepID=UPI0022B86DB7|nr:protein translocase subunit SecD [Desulfovibrio subterraneus]WBF67944.1 protein translocase subunit SecD [Desulfovibrio subterraneus]
MKEGLRWRILVALLVTMLGLAYALPSVPFIGNSGLQKVLPKDKISLGLDLMGGIYLTLGVDVEKAIENTLAQTGQDLRTVAREEKINILRPRVLGGDKLELVLVKADQREALNKLIAEKFSHLTNEAPVDMEEGKVRYSLSYTKEYRKYLADLALDQAVKTIRNRIDQFGVSEPDIRKQQDYRIQIQLPGLSDPERAIQIIGKTAHLEFRMVKDDANVENAKRGIVPPGYEALPMVSRNPDGTYSETVLVVEKDAAMTGEYVQDAYVNFDHFNQSYVGLTFNASGARRFEQITGDHAGRRMAIVLDGKIHSAPVIQEKIRGGRASISGRFTKEEAHDLAIVLRAGSLPAPVNILEERSVGPSLGQESIDQGVTAALIGGVLVMVFMIVYYGFGGVVADIVLCLNIVLIMAGLAVFGATLTLPGIAGIILTLGMAVDANVLIFERIREELRRGLTPLAAITEGYNRATLTIFDANITTLITAVILYQFGTGPIRGFAVTLSLGILASMFTAIFCSRILFDLWAGTKQRTKLSI